MRSVAVLLLIAVAVAAAIGANFVLLGYGRGTGDPVGRLSPRLSGVTDGGSGAITPTAPQSGDDLGHGQGHDDD